MTGRLLKVWPCFICVRRSSETRRDDGRRRYVWASRHHDSGGSDFGEIAGRARNWRPHRQRRPAAWYCYQHGEDIRSLARAAASLSGLPRAKRVTLTQRLSSRSVADQPGPTPSALDSARMIGCTACRHFLGWQAGEDGLFPWLRSAYRCGWELPPRIYALLLFGACYRALFWCEPLGHARRAPPTKGQSPGGGGALLPLGLGLRAIQTIPMVARAAQLLKRKRSSVDNM